MEEIKLAKRKKGFWDIWDSFGIYIFLGVVVVLFAILVDVVKNGGNFTFLTFENLLNVFSNAAPVAICAVAMVLCITSGAFDMSVGAISTLSTVIVGTVLNTLAVNDPSINHGLLLALGVGAVIVVALIGGAINGALIALLRIPAFITTLATMLMYRGIAGWIANSKDFSIGQGDASAAQVYKEISTGLGGALPVVITLIVLVIGFMIYKYTKFGVNVRALGSNEVAAKTSGIPASMTTIVVFMGTALLASFAGIFFSSRLMSASGNFNNGFELEVITSTIIGGTALSGGKGNVLGAFFAAALLAVVQSGCNLLSVTDSMRALIVGIILLLSLSLGGIREIARSKEIRG